MFTDLEQIYPEFLSKNSSVISNPPRRSDCFSSFFLLLFLIDSLSNC